MKNVSQSKIIIFFFTILFLGASVYLFAIDSRYNNPTYNKSWYALSFNDPKSNSLDFTIENFSQGNTFHWEILSDKIKLSDGDVSIDNGTKKTISVANASTAGKMTINVSAGDIKQAIYKNINN